MSEQQGEKTEQPTQRRLEEAVKRGQFPRSAEVQTVFVLLAALMALQFTGHQAWDRLAGVFFAVLGHLHDIPISFEAMQGYWIGASLLAGALVGPIVIACVVGGLVAGSIQNRFQTASEALSVNWDRINPLEGFKRIASPRALVPTGMGALKLAVVVGLSASEVRRVIEDPIFFTAVDVAGVAAFLAKSSFSIALRITGALAVIAALDYGYQYWRTSRDLMMTKEEVREEMKSTEGNAEMKARRRRRRAAKTQRSMLLEIPKADVVVTNPTHLAVALRYDRGTMKAPRIVAKGARLNAQKIREIARQHHIPIVENKPLARMMFKHGRVGGEVPAQFYAAVAEILAYVYRINRFRYYAQQTQV